MKKELTAQSKSTILIIIKETKTINQLKEELTMTIKKTAHKINLLSKMTEENGCTEGEAVSAANLIINLYNKLNTLDKVAAKECYEARINAQNYLNSRVTQEPVDLKAIIDCKWDSDDFSEEDIITALMDAGASKEQAENAYSEYIADLLETAFDEVLNKEEKSEEPEEWDLDLDGLFD